MARMATFAHTVQESLEDTATDVTALAEELAESRDNMEEHFSSTRRYEIASEAADVLEGLDLEDKVSQLVDAISAVAALAENTDDPGTWPDLLGATITFPETRSSRPSRGDRVANMANALNAAFNYLSDNIPKEGDLSKLEGVDNVLLALDEIRDAAQELEALEFS